jgi:glycosyltransferase involved in cell wall biosynthesis
VKTREVGRIHSGKQAKSRQAQKRHCMVVHAYYPLGETRVEREALALINHGHEVDVICLRDEGEAPEECIDNIKVYRLPVQRSKQRGQLRQLLEYLTFLLLASLKLARLHMRQRYGIVQVHNLPDFLVFAALFPKLMGARVILDLHDLMPEFFAARSNSAMQSLPVRIVIWQEQLSCRFANHVITVTEVWRQTLIQRGVPAHKVSVVMNVADTRIFRPVSAKPASKPNDRFDLIYHGTFTHRYGVDLVLKAMAKVRREIPNIHLTLIGSGDAREELEALTDQLDLRDHVEFSQLVPAARLPELIGQAEVGVVPNRDDLFTTTLLPTKLLEYVALDTPVIAARTQTIGSYFDDTMVKFFRPGDVDDLARCILDLHQNRSQLKSLARNAARFGEQYSWRKLARDYAGLVESLYAS